MAKCSWCGTSINSGTYCSQSCKSQHKHYDPEDYESKAKFRSLFGWGVVILFIIVVATQAGQSNSSTGTVSQKYDDNVDEATPTQIAPNNEDQTDTEKSHTPSESYQNVETKQHPARSQTDNTPRTWENIPSSQKVSTQEVGEQQNILGGASTQTISDTEKRVQNLLRSGYSVRDIHKKTGLDKSYIRSIKKRM